MYFLSYMYVARFEIFSFLTEISRWPEFLSACNVTGENLTEEQIAFDKYRAEERLSRRSAPAFRCPPVNKKCKVKLQVSNL